MKATTQKNLRRRSRGQGMTEYVIMVSLIAIAAIGVITLFGDNIRALFGASAQALAGQTSLANPADGAERQELRKKNIGQAFQNNGY